MTEEKSNTGILDKRKFKEIFNENYQSLFFLSRNYLDDEDEAKGVVQEAFVKLWDIRDDLKEDTNHRNFLFKMVKNNCLNILKRRQLLLKHHEKIKSLELHYQYESLNKIGFDYLQVKELKEKIDQSIKNLPEHCRIVFELSRFEQLKNREIAERLGVSQKTVEAHLTKSLKILRSDLKEYLPLIIFLARLVR